MNHQTFRKEQLEGGSLAGVGRCGSAVVFWTLREVVTSGHMGLSAKVSFWFLLSIEVSEAPTSTRIKCWPGQMGWLDPAAVSAQVKEYSRT